MDQRIWPFVGLGTLGLGAVVAATWVFSVDTSVRAPLRGAELTQAEPVPRPEAVMSRRERIRRQRGQAKAEGRRFDRKAKVKAAKEQPKKERKRILEPDELVWARTEFREQRMDDMNRRLDAHAQEEDWDEDVTEEVRDILGETIDRITDRLVEVDRGDEDWAEMKRDMRAFRERQADRVAEVLGPDRFEAFVEGMGFSRFEGEEPISGRLRMRRRRRQAP